MNIAWKIFRAIVSVLLLLIVVVPVSLYVLLSLDPVQNFVKDIAVTELSRTLGASVDIEKVRVHPFNRLSVSGISLSEGTDTIAEIDNVSGGFELFHFLRSGELIIDYALVDGARFRLSRDSIGAPLNIENILRRLKSDEPRADKAFDLTINTVVLRNGSLGYDVLSEPLDSAASFDANHIAISSLELNAFIPRISNAGYAFTLDHFAFKERSGFELKTMRLKAEISDHAARVTDFVVELPRSVLALKPLWVSYTDLSKIGEALRSMPLEVATSGPAVIYLPDIDAFLPQLGSVNRRFAFDFDVAGNLNQVNLRSFAMRDVDGGAFSLVATAEADSLGAREKMGFKLDRLALNIDGRELSALTAGILPLSVRKKLSLFPDLTLALRGNGKNGRGTAALEVFGSPGALHSDLDYIYRNKTFFISGDVVTDNFRLDLLTGNSDLGQLTAKISGDAELGRTPEFDIDFDAESLEYRGYAYTGISSRASLDSRKRLDATVNVNDPGVALHAFILYSGEGERALQATATLADADLCALGLYDKRPDYKLGAKLNVEVTGGNLVSLEGNAELHDIKWVNERNEGLKVNSVKLEAAPLERVPHISVESDFFSGAISGKYDFGSLPSQISALVRKSLPALAGAGGADKAEDGNANDFTFDFTLQPCKQITDFFGLPVHALYDVDISGRFNSDERQAYVHVDAPYLQQGDKLYENTSIFAMLDGDKNDNRVYITSQFPTKKGDMAVSALVTALDSRLDTRIDWAIERAIPLNGTISFATELRKIGKTAEETFPVDATVDFLPGTINFGDEVWSIVPSTIDVTPDRVAVKHFALEAGSQAIAIDGAVGKSETDSITVGLRTVALLPVFETLEIDNALIGGRATGVFTAKDLLGGNPFLECPSLHVDSIGYQRCTIGDADILAQWNNERKSFYLDADITGLEGRKSRIFGDIYPFTEALDMNFDADSVPVGFLKPFMAAFTSDISGRASGQCRLFGTFKEIDLEGNIFADNVKIKIDFTGTSYTATDSVHLLPGKIKLDNITIRDAEGHTALLNGEVGHTFFKEPTFKFDITNARNFLSYNVTPRENPDWYGTIYGNGGASVSGYPGVVNINVNMATAPRSSFTFVLNDRLDAEDYSFLTFRDITPDSLRAQTTVHDDTPEAVLAFKKKVAEGDDSPSEYNMDIIVDVNKDATMTLVMDPVGGDEIKAHGDGNLHLAYRSANNDLNIWGKYTLADGSYKFTLQDIIIKDFTIKEGSMIQFDGDPYGVKTNLEAFYATNANLSDLDESFLQDKEVARTNVPVHALMKVTGDIRQPAIDFDLEFPTLTQDTYRKVRSIVSTSDMMNRQIIYLLALNRFYTPDYVASTTKGSELFSVASSTISSQLGNILGKLSDKWSIAPNFRSDRGDFSDVEVDVALSSRLLNNRLIFNGNFGYRDKALNSNQFIGDFDIEYLLNKRGTWRLKAYNRYNDRNYYVRTAQTTQGVGIMFRRDFDSFFSFLRRKHKPVEEQKETDNNK